MGIEDILMKFRIVETNWFYDMRSTFCALGLLNSPPFYNRKNNFQEIG